jgi:hypothetical protein
VYKFFSEPGAVRRKSRSEPKKVLDDINLVLKPGKMYPQVLQLAAKQALRAISGNLHPGGRKIS